MHVYKVKRGREPEDELEKSHIIASSFHNCDFLLYVWWTSTSDHIIYSYIYSTGQSNQIIMMTLGKRFHRPTFALIGSDQSYIPLYYININWLLPYMFSNCLPWGWFFTFQACKKVYIKTGFTLMWFMFMNSVLCKKKITALCTTKASQPL